MEIKICKCIAMHNSKDVEISFNDFFEYGLQIFKELNLVPNYVGIKGAGFPNKTITFSSGSKKLRSKNFANVEGINLIFSQTQQNAPSYEWEYSLCLNNSDGANFYFCGDILTLKDAFIEKIINEMQQFSSFEYGYGFCREFNKGPEYYINGVISGDVSEIESDAIAKWWKDRIGPKKYSEGKLRDIYDVNFINDKHLQFDLKNGTKLMDYINSEKSTTIKKINQNQFLWFVPSSSILSIRRELSETGILIAYGANVNPTCTIYRRFD